MNPVLIQRARRQSPFRSFFLRANDGRRFPVMQPEHVLVTTKLLVVVNPETNAPMHVSPEDIAEIEYVESESRPHGHQRDS